MTNKVLGGGALDGNLGLNPDFSTLTIPLGRVVQSVDNEGYIQYWIIEETLKAGGNALANGLYANSTTLKEVAGGVSKLSVQNRQAIEAVYKAQGYNNVFFFEDGFTYAEPNDVGVYSDGTAWTYVDIGALPVTIAAGTVPSEGVYDRARVKASSVILSDDLSVQDFIDSNLFTPVFDNIADMIANLTAASWENKTVKTNGYYTAGDGGGANYIVSSGNVGDGFSDHNIGGYTAKLKGVIIDIRKAGAKTEVGYDNVNHIKSAVKKGRGLVPDGKFYSSSIRFGSEFNGKSLVGLGVNSRISLISEDIGAIGSPLIHIPRVGGAYGGTYVGAKDFYLDNLSLYGGDSTSANEFATTGLVLENSEGFAFGTLWCHGFYKSGLLLDGTCKGMTGINYFGYDNGNQVGANTGGQGLAFSIDNESFQSAYINNVECYGNGLQNFGQGLDAASGNFGIGNLSCHGNGSSAMKIVSASKVDIGTIKSSGNNTHTAQPFSAVYTNGDFGVLTIGVLDSEDSAASSLAHTRSGTINVGRFISTAGAGSGVVVQPAAGKTAILNLDNAEVSNPATTGFTVGGSGFSEVCAGVIKVSGSPNQGAVVTGGKFICQTYKSINNTGTPLFFSSGDDHFIGSFNSESLVANSAIVIGASVNNAAIISARSSGHSQTLSDSGVNTYKPNII